MKLIIELDGGSHVMKKEADKFRDEELKAMGYTTLRFSNDEVIFNTHEVWMMLEGWIKSNHR